MSALAHFVVTLANGDRSLWANVRNTPSFRAAMMTAGNDVRFAAAADLEAAGIAGTIDRMPAVPVAILHIAKLPSSERGAA
jgi:hypothetical protein